MLSQKANKIIDQYLNLPFAGVHGVRCPYFINSRKNYRGQIRALIGKGTPEEIVEEAKIASIQYHHNLFDHDGRCQVANSNESHVDTAKTIRKFLIDNNIGIDCSGFAAHVLRAHFLEAKGVDIFKIFHFWPVKHTIKWLLAKLRPAENLSVKVFAKNENSRLILSGNEPVDLNKIESGDIIVMFETGPNKRRNHIILIEEVDKNIIKYISSRAWSSEGKYGHGVSRGEIEIIAPGRRLLDQTWEELGKINDLNESYLEARDAKILEIRRIII